MRLHAALQGLAPHDLADDAQQALHLLERESAADVGDEPDAYESHSPDKRRQHERLDAPASNENDRRDGLPLASRKLGIRDNLPYVHAVELVVAAHEQIRTEDASGADRERNPALICNQTRPPNALGVGELV